MLRCNKIILKLSEVTKKTIVVTRIAKESEILAQNLEQQGFATLIEPLFELKKVDFARPNGDFIAVLLTSQNASKAFLRCDFDKNTKIFAVGKKTAKKLLAAGYINILIPQIEDGENLKKLILADLPLQKGRILYFCGEKISMDFAFELAPFGFEVEKIICYTMQERANLSADFWQKFLKKELDFVVIYSQNSAAVFLRLFVKILEENNLKSFDKKLQILCFSDKIARFCFASIEGADLRLLQNFVQISTDKINKLV